MNAHKFVAVHGLERAVSTMEDAHVLAHQIWIDEIGLVDLEELKQVVESVEIVESYDGLLQAKAYMTRYFKLNGAFRKNNPKTGKFITKKMNELQQAIECYETIESLKENQHV